MFKQNIGIMIAVAQLAATQPRFAAVQNEFRRFGIDIVAASVRRAQEQGYGAELDPEHTAAAIALLFENFTTVFVGTPASGSRSATRTPSPRCRRFGRRRCTGSETSRRRRSPWISPCRTIFPGLLAEMDAFIEAEIKPLERETHAVLRPPPRVRPHRLGQRRHPAAGVGGPARRDAPARRQRRAGCATVCRRSSAAATAPTSTWRSSGNTWRTRDSACTTTCRTSRRSSATSRRSS